LISGLHALHSHEILHLDIKPENILFENNEIDARIKITDFGLSKMFSNINEKDSKMPTMDEINERLKAFQESGVLDRDRLRGTVGYMAPELILMGHSSKATDVFAAGVVLYILLCGHPPFQSKSNREILEKTAKGQYKMVSYGPLPFFDSQMHAGKRFRLHLTTFFEQLLSR
jgi:serine/threonine protein kinase